MKYFIAAAIVLSLAVPSQAKIRKETVEYTQGDTKLVGYLAYGDATKAKRPGVLIVHEWWGLNDHAKRRADELAKHGYVALALDMYGEGKNTEHPKEAGEWATAIRQNKKLGKDRFMAAYSLLRKQKFCDPTRIAAVGYCFGGSVVLTMALENVDLRGVVSFHGSPPTDPVAAKNIKAKILVCHGADDAMITADQIATFKGILDGAGADWQFISYGGAKHSFTNPDADKRGIPGLAYNEAAAQRSWKAMMVFFAEVFVK